jgi:hypothetical protein
MVEYLLLTWIGMNLYYVDTYSSVSKCLTQAELLFENRSEYMCVPNNHLNKQRIVKGIFDKSMLPK